MKDLKGSATEFFRKRTHTDCGNQEEKNPWREIKEFIKTCVAEIEYAGVRKYKQEEAGKE